MTTTQLAKRQLRRAMAATLAAVPQHELLAQSAAVAATLAAMPLVQTASRVGVYMNMDHSELKTLPIIEMLFAMGKKVYLPHCAPLDGDFRRYESQRSKLIFYHMPTLQSVLDLEPQGKYKLKEPTSGLNLMDESEGLDLLLLPAVAYTKDCYRLGHGVGFYDDYIKRHKEKFGKTPYLLGTGLKEQLVESLPTEEHDEKLHAVVLNDKIYMSVACNK